ncbi:Serpin family [Trema orientale]|uniref:Serpin family n=1 Tax=Trema orientale TaxID=63057 RepID=A0A2P5F6Y4_TREOI|nr:Serpin family [Trema orientale]
MSLKPNEAVDEVSSWAEKATKGIINALLPYESVHNNTALVLANALYFKGSWDQKFDASKTQTKDFHILNRQIVGVPFMATDTSFEWYLHRCFDGFKPYVEINKEGTDSAAGKAVTCEMDSAARSYPSFVADHPFLFMITEETYGNVFFVGAALNPLLDS